MQAFRQTIRMIILTINLKTARVTACICLRSRRMKKLETSVKIILLNLSEKLKGPIPPGHRDDALLAASESIEAYVQCSINIRD